MFFDVYKKFISLLLIFSFIFHIALPWKNVYGNTLPENLIDNNQNGIPDGAESKGDEMPQIVYDALPKEGDTDNDGIPDVWDDELNAESNSSFDELKDTMDEIIDFLASCNGGGCIDMPINYAFFVPGKPNIISPILELGLETGIPGLDDALNGVKEGISKNAASVLDKVGLHSGYQPYVMTVYNSGPGTFCVWSSCWTKAGTPIAYDTGFAASTFRFYISPTLTGGIGLVTCMGPGGSRYAPMGKCFIQAVENKLLKAFCKKLSAKIDNASYVSIRSGEQLFKVESALENFDSSEILHYSLSEVDTAIPSAQNVRVNGGPSWFGRWMNRQIEELSALFVMPAITIYYPDITNTFSGDDGSFDLLAGFVDTESFDEAKKGFKKHTSNQSFENYWLDKKENEKIDINSYTKNIVNNVYKKLEPVEKYIENAKYKAKSISDFYRMMEAVPILTLNRDRIIIKYPSLSKKELMSKITDLEDWIDYAKDELEEFKKNANWLENSKNSLIEEAERFIEDIEKLKEVLEFYRDEAPRLIADFDSEISKYLYSMICYIDAISELTGTWLLRNKIRYEQWIELFDTIPKILKSFQKLPNIFKSYQGYCEQCRASNYDSGNFIIEIVGKIFPEPPVVKFPRLPDIVLDISRINAGITITIPELIIKPTRIRIPNLPFLSLPALQDPNFKFNFPKLPNLPRFEIPTLPDFPAIPLPKLPDIPPPPIIPNFMAKFGKWLDIIEKGLFLYCLIVRKGLFIYPEITAMSIVESLTARPIKPLRMDFLSVKVPTIAFPSISEIKVLVETNLEQDISIVSEKTEEFAKEINEKTTNFLKDTRNVDFSVISDVLDLSEGFDNINETINDGTYLINKGVNDPLKNLEEKVEETSSDIQDKINYNLEKNPYIDSEIEKLRNMLLAEGKSLKETKGLTVAEYRKSVELPKWTPKSISSKYKTRYKEMREELTLAKSFYEDHSEKILATNDINSVLGIDFPPEKVYASTEVSNLSNTQTSDIFKPIDTSKSASSGIFLQDDKGESFKLMNYEEEQKTIHSFFFIDSNKNNEKDIVYATPFEIFIKTR